MPVEAVQCAPIASDCQYDIRTPNHYFQDIRPPVNGITVNEKAGDLQRRLAMIVLRVDVGACSHELNNNTLNDLARATVEWFQGIRYQLLQIEAWNDLHQWLQGRRRHREAAHRCAYFLLA